MSQSRAVVAERGVMEAAMRAADQRVRAQAARACSALRRSLFGFALGLVGCLDKEQNI